jgi:hypothetical protein
MRKSRIIQLLFGLMAVVCNPFDAAYAQTSQTWVSGTGQDTNNCSRTLPCQFASGALAKTIANGQINMLDPAEVGGAFITKSISIVNENTGNVVMSGGSNDFGGGPGLVVIAAGANGVVTLRGLVIDQSLGTAILINNAHQINIENCLIRDNVGAGIAVNPNVDGQPQTLASSINVAIRNTTITGSAAGIKITSVPGVAVNVAVENSFIVNNSGGGVRADGSSGDPITVSISNSTVSLNSGNGINAIAGNSQNIVSIKHSIIAKNGGAGVQVNGVNAGMLLSATLLDQNVAGATSVVSGGNMFTYGNNEVVGGAGSGFNHAAGLQ